MRIRSILALVMLAVVAGGCFKADVRIEVNDDGSGSYDALVAFNADQMASLSEGFGSGLETDGGTEVTGGGDETCADMESGFGFDDADIPEGAVVEPYDEDGFCGNRVHLDFEPGTDLTSLFQEGEDVESGTFVLEERGDEWYFEADLGDVGLADAGLDTGTADPEDEFGSAMANAMLGGAQYTFAVKLPGRQIEHNADSIESDGTLVWDIDITDPTDARLFARTEPGDPITGSAGSDDGGGFNWGILIGVIAVIGVGAVAFVAVQRRRSDATTAPPEPEPTPTGSLPPPPPA